MQSMKFLYIWLKYKYSLRSLFYYDMVLECLISCLFRSLPLLHDTMWHNGWNIMTKRSWVWPYIGIPSLIFFSLGSKRLFFFCETCYIKEVILLVLYFKQTHNIINTEKMHFSSTNPNETTKTLVFISKFAGPWFEDKKNFVKCISVQHYIR